MTTRATNGRREWTAEEHAELWRMSCEGVRLSEMAKRLKRSESSCHGRLKNSDGSGQYIGRGKSVRWTPDMDAQVLDMSAAGMTHIEIGAHMCLIPFQVASRVRQLRAWMVESSAGYAKAKLASEIARGPSMRRCLMCGHEFPSSSAENRRCKPCKRLAESSDSPFNPGIVGGI